MKRLTIEILGLEGDIFSSLSARERSLYSLVTICFLGFFLLSIFSSFFIAFLITGSYLLSFFIGIFLVFVINSVIRFSLLIIKRPVSKVLEEKEPISDTAAIVSPSVTPVTPIPASKFSTFLNKFDFRKIFKSGQVPGFNFMLRTFFSSVFSLILIFPLTALINKSSVNSLLEQKRTELYQENHKIIHKDFQLKVSRQQELINTASIKLKRISEFTQMNSISYKNQVIEIAKLKQELQEIKEEFYNGISQQLSLYKRSLNASYFPIYIFRNCTHFNGFLFISALIFALVFFPQILLVRLKNNLVFQYAKLSNDYYHERIHGQYQKSKTWAEDSLSSLNSSKSKVVLNSKYEDPPYNTKKIKQIRKCLSELEFINQLKTN